MFLSHPSTFITASDPQIFGDRRSSSATSRRAPTTRPQDWPHALRRRRPAVGHPDRRRLHRRRPVRRPGPLPERRRLRREGLRASTRSSARPDRPDDRTAGHRHDGVHHPRRRHQPGGPHQRRGRRVGRDALLPLQPDRQPGRDPLRAAVRPGRARPAHRERERTPLGLLSGAPSGELANWRGPGHRSVSHGLRPSRLRG